jgi:hypothetical protein
MLSSFAATLCSAISISLNHARLSAAAPSFAALKTNPHTQARARTAGKCCSRCCCRCGYVGLQCCSSTRGSAGRGILLFGNLEHCSSQQSSIISCCHIAAESRSRDLRWWLEYVLPCLCWCVCVLCLFWLGNRMVEWAGVGLLFACASLMPCAAGSVYSNAVDIFNVTSGAWSTAALKVARHLFAATSLPNLGVAIFAGGSSTCCHADFSCVCVLCFFLVVEWDG